MSVALVVSPGGGPDWRRLRGVTGGPGVLAAPRRYRGRPLALAITARMRGHYERARRDPAQRHVSDADLALALAVTVFGPDGFDPPPDVWADVVAFASTVADWRVPAWEIVLLFGCGRGRHGADDRSRSRWRHRCWSYALQQMRELLREGVQCGVSRLQSWGKLRFDDREQRRERIDGLVGLLLSSLIEDDCPCPTRVQARHAETRARRCRREHSLAGWRLGGPVTVGRAVLQAVLGTVNLASPAFGGLFARGMLFCALEELVMAPVAFWACDRPACQPAGAFNYWTKRCRGRSCRQLRDERRHRIQVLDDQVVNVELGKRMPFFRCPCPNWCRLRLDRSDRVVCLLCGTVVAPGRSGRWPRPKRAWT